MSKHQDSLRQAQETRGNKYTLVLKKRSSEETPVQAQPDSALAQTPKPRIRVLRVLFTFFIFMVFVVNIVIFLTLKIYTSREKKNNSIKKSSQIKTTKAIRKKFPYNKTPR